MITIISIHPVFYIYIVLIYFEEILFLASAMHQIAIHVYTLLFVIPIKRDIVSSCGSFPSYILLSYHHSSI